MLPDAVPHWRVLDGPPPISADLADVDRVVEFWGGSPAVRRRLDAINDASATVTLFLEHVPHTLPQWLSPQLAAGTADAGAAISMLDRSLRVDVASMNAAGLFHFDLHLDNILTDGERLYFADFGLAVARQFELSPEETHFLDANISHDPCHAITRLVDFLVTECAGTTDWAARNELVRRCALGEDITAAMSSSAAGVVRRYAPIAVVVNDFYRQLHLEDRATSYPAVEVQRACVAAPWR